MITKIKNKDLYCDIDLSELEGEHNLSFIKTFKFTDGNSHLIGYGFTSFILINLLAQDDWQVFINNLGERQFEEIMDISITTT